VFFGISYEPNSKDAPRMKRRNIRIQRNLREEEVLYKNLPSTSVDHQ